MGLKQLDVNMAYYMERELTRPTTQEDVDKHQQKMNSLLARATTNPTDIPPELRKGTLDGMVVKVAATDLHELATTGVITNAVRLLLDKGANNQKYSCNMANTLRGEYLAKMVASPYTTDAAINATIVGVGLCDKFATVGFQLAKLFNVPAAIVSDTTKGHTYLRLYQDKMSDAWTHSPTVCLESEYNMDAGSLKATFTPDEAINPAFNLHKIELVQEAIARQLGPDAIENGMFDHQREKHKITDPLLEQYREQQGVFNYKSISTEGMGREEREKIDAAQKDVTRRLEQALLRSAATGIDVKWLSDNSVCNIDSSVCTSMETLEQAGRRAASLAVGKLKIDVLDLAKDAARNAPKYRTQLSADCEMVYDITHPDNPLVNIPVTVTPSITLFTKPWLWNAGNNAKQYPLYIDENGQMWKNQPPKEIIDKAWQAREDAKSKPRDQRFPRYHRQLQPEGQGAPYMADPQVISATNLQKVNELMLQLELHNGGVATLKKLENRLEDLPPENRTDVLMQLCLYRRTAAPAAASLAREIVAKWSRLEAPAYQAIFAVDMEGGQ